MRCPRPISRNEPDPDTGGPVGRGDPEERIGAFERILTWVLRLALGISLLPVVLVLIVATCVAAVICKVGRGVEATANLPRGNHQAWGGVGHPVK
jgi:hypothetical protein